MNKILNSTLRTLSIIIMVPILIAGIPIIPKKKDEGSNNSTIVLIANIKHLVKCLIFIILVVIYFTTRYFTS